MSWFNKNRMSKKSWQIKIFIFHMLTMLLLLLIPLFNGVRVQWCFINLNMVEGMLCFHMNVVIMMSLFQLQIIIKLLCKKKDLKMRKLLHLHMFMHLVLFKTLKNWNFSHIQDLIIIIIKLYLVIVIIFLLRTLLWMIKSYKVMLKILR